MSSWNMINNKHLMEIYYRSLELELDKRFIQIVIDEMVRRGIDQSIYGKRV